VFERSDETLIKQALKGKESAWITLVKRYETNMYQYTYRMVSNPDDALDLMQDIFLAVFRNLSTFRGDSPFKGWLFRIAHYRCMEFYRKKRPHHSLDEVPEYEDDIELTPEFSLSNNQQNDRIQKAMQLLPLNQRLVVELKFFQQLTFEEISFQLGESTNTVKSRIYSALDKLKVAMEVSNVE